MKKAVIFVVIILIAGWYLQNYTNFKAFDLAKDYWQKIDWEKLNVFSGDKTTADPEKQLNIFIRDGKFVPSLNAANVGIKITWFNEDSKAHSVSGEGWGSGEIAPGKAWSRTFDVAGDYKYKCSLYPSMTGEIIIK